MEKIKQKKEFWILAVIVLAGVFLRTWHFHDWLRFSLDQSRDAFLISDAATGKTPWPLLGPLAGGTNFQLGPAYYYFSILSAKIFGNHPDRMAYPSLIFSISALPLFYFLVREYFDRKISWLLTGLMSVSWFFVESSRFSSNPNLIPFFVLLYLWSALKILKDRNVSWHWPVFLGVSLGIAIQLHTTLLVILPVFTFLFFIYLLATGEKEDRLKKIKYLTIVFVVSLAVNLPQLKYEFDTGGKNVRQFIAGFEKKGEVDEGIFQNALTTAVCQAKAGANFVFSLPEVENCSKRINLNIEDGAEDLYPQIRNRQFARDFYFLNIFITVTFSLSGFFLWIFYSRRRKDAGGRKFLFLAASFWLVSMIFLLPVVSSISTGYFNIVFFVPFVMLGLIFEFISDKLKGAGRIAVFLIAAAALLLNLSADRKAFSIYARGLDNNEDNSDLAEIENMSAYILENSKGPICLGGERDYRERFSRPVSYMLYRFGKETLTGSIGDIEKNCSGEKIFFIRGLDGKTLPREENIDDYPVIGEKKFKNTGVYILKKTNEKN